MKLLLLADKESPYLWDYYQPGRPRNAQAVEHDQLIFNAVAALRRTPVIIAVVVAAHIIKRRAAKRSQK